jgi:hypothetical protein
LEGLEGSVLYFRKGLLKQGLSVRFNRRQWAFTVGGTSAGKGGTMTERDIREKARVAETGLDKTVEHLDVDLEIMERHADEIADVETDIQESMKKWDREYKDTRLHSIPKPRKHIR